MVVTYVQLNMESKSLGVMIQRSRVCVGLGVQVHVVISGKVQGLYYRKWTVDNATKLSLNGWVRNRKDGTVEAVFFGKPNAVDHMVVMCKSGPSRARVAHVKVTMAAGPPKKGFEQLDDGHW